MVINAMGKEKKKKEKNQRWIEREREKAMYSVLMVVRGRLLC